MLALLFWVRLRTDDDPQGKPAYMIVMHDSFMSHFPAEDMPQTTIIVYRLVNAVMLLDDKAHSR